MVSLISAWTAVLKAAPISSDSAPRRGVRKTARAASRAAHFFSVKLNIFFIFVITALTALTNGADDAITNKPIAQS